jgi:hypothetical protein
MKDAVRRRIEELGDEGGHMLAAVNNIQSDVAPRTSVKCSMQL